MGAAKLIEEKEAPMGENRAELIDFSNEVQTWAWDEANKRPAPHKVTVGDAANHFKRTPQEIVRAVRSHYWMYLELPGGALADDPEADLDEYAPVTFDDPRSLVIGHEGE